MERINLNISCGNKNNTSTNVISRDKAILIIKSRRYSESVEKKLIKKLSNYPINTYEYFLNNIESFI
jgi:hypothetical protein